MIKLFLFYSNDQVSLNLSQRLTRVVGIPTLSAAEKAMEKFRLFSFGESES